MLLAEASELIGSGKAFRYQYMIYVPVDFRFSARRASLDGDSCQHRQMSVNWNCHVQVA